MMSLIYALQLFAKSPAADLAIVTVKSFVSCIFHDSHARHWLQRGATACHLRQRDLIELRYLKCLSSGPIKLLRLNDNADPM
jgi:hypothetical protein